MRNITVSVDDDTYRRSRIRAAELDTSVSALVVAFSWVSSEIGPTGRVRRRRRSDVGDCWKRYSQISRREAWG